MKAAKNRKKSVSKKPAKAKGASAKTGVKPGPLKKKLLAMQEDLRRTIRRKQDLDLVDQDVGDEADQATHSLDKELLFEQSDNERVMLEQVEAALRKMEKGAYGICESCQKPISKERIQAIPFARYCIACQSTVEHTSFGATG